MTGYMPFGARRTMTQSSSVSEDEETKKEIEEEDIDENLRLFIRETLQEIFKS